MKKQFRNNKKRNLSPLLLPLFTIIGIGFLIVISMYYEPSWNFNWTEIRKEIKDSIKLAEYRGITSGTGGMGISTINEVKTRMWIMNNATKSELLELTEYPNGTVKAIAYEGLLRKKKKYKKVELILKAIKDTTYLLSYQSGCIGWNRKIADYLIQDVLMIDDGILPPEAISKIELTELEKEIILLEYKKYY